MKKLMMFCLAAFACTSMALAQDSTANHKMHSSDKMKMMKDCVMMEDGKLMVMKGGKTTAMTQDMTLTNGATIMSDGSVKMHDGTTRKLSNGDCVYMDGKIVRGKKGGMHKKASKPAGQ
jgi:hypothetical protein